MASQGPRYPTAAVNNSVAPENTDAWVSPTNVGADDASEASITAASYDSPDISQQLVTSGYGFTIPAGAVIDGIVVEIMRRNSAGAASDNRVQLRDATGTLVGDNKADLPTDWPTAEALATYGSSTDKWNATPTDVMVNDADFGVVLSVQADAANTDIQVDFIRVTVYYTETNIVVTPGTASLVLTSFAPTIQLPKRVTPPTASLLLTGFAPVIRLGQILTVPKATLTLTTFAPNVTVAVNVNVVPGTAALVITRFPPTIQLPRVVTPGTRALIITRFPPTVINPQRSTPLTASLILLTFAPTVIVDDPSRIVYLPHNASTRLVPPPRPGLARILPPPPPGVAIHPLE